MTGYLPQDSLLWRWDFAMFQLRKFGAYNNVDGLDPAKALLQMGLSKGYYKNIFAKYFYNGCGVEASK